MFVQRYSHICNGKKDFKKKDDTFDFGQKITIVTAVFFTGSEMYYMQVSLQSFIKQWQLQNLNLKDLNSKIKLKFMEFVYEDYFIKAR